MLCDRQFFRECFLAGFAEELIVGHTDLPQSLTDSIWILDPRLEQVQHINVPSRKANSTYTAGLWHRRLKRFLRLLFGF
jgi:hypothetical protein